MSATTPKVRATRILRADNITVAKLGERMEVSKPCAWRCIKTLKDMDLIHVARYQKCCTGVMEAVYAWGSGDDAARPYLRKPADELFDIPRPVLAFWHDRVFAVQDRSPEAAA